MDTSTPLHSPRHASDLDLSRPTAEIAESGVDISQLRANRRLTPEERLANMLVPLRFVERYRGALWCHGRCPDDARALAAEQPGEHNNAV